jgi:cytoskeletal protein RodZ
LTQTGLGAALRRAREEQGLTLEDAERDTRISKRYLDALENERFDVVPAPVYARGFLRSYSQYLGLDPNEVLSLYPREDEQQPRQQRGRSRDRQPATPPPGDEDLDTPAEARPREPQPLRPTTLTHRDSYDSERRQAFLWIAIAVGAIIVVAIVAFLITQAGDDGEPNLPTDSGDTSTSTAVSTSTAPAGGGTEPAGTATVGGDGTTTTLPGTVPNLIGMTGAEAVDTLDGLGIPWQITTIDGADEQTGIVLDQAPLPGEPVEDGNSVILLVSPPE